MKARTCCSRSFSRSPRLIAASTAAKSAVELASRLDAVVSAIVNRFCSSFHHFHSPIR